MADDIYYYLRFFFGVLLSMGQYEVCSKIRGLFELRESSWFRENPLGVASFVQLS